MTIGIAWIRNTGCPSDELWMASDSRLTGDGFIWDECPKIVPLPRHDMLAAFAGETMRAYPLMLQLANAISAYEPAKDGSLEFFDTLGHMERVINSMMGSLIIDPGLTNDDARDPFTSRADTLIVGGFSRLHPGLVLRQLHHQQSAGGWAFGRVRGLRAVGSNRTFVLFGDRSSKSRFMFEFKSLLDGRGILGDDGPLNLEPLDALIGYMRNRESRLLPLAPGERFWTVGGAPQVGRVRAGAHSNLFVTDWGGDHPGPLRPASRRWRTGGEQVTLPGRSSRHARIRPTSEGGL